MLTQTPLLTCLVLALISVSLANVVPDDKTTKAEPVPSDIKELLSESRGQVITVESHGKEVTIPAYKPDTKLSEERYELDHKILNVISKEVRFVTNQILIRRVYSVTLAKNLVGLSRRLQQIFNEDMKLWETDKESPMLLINLGPSFERMLERFFDKSTRTEVLTPKEAQQRVEVFTDAMVQVGKLSHTGNLLPWTLMKLDGMLIDDYLRPVVKLLSEGSLLVRRLIRSAADLVKGQKVA